MELAPFARWTRRLRRIVCCAVVLALCSHAMAADDLGNIARQIAAQIDDPSNIRSDPYAPSFLQSIPVSKIAVTYSALHGSFGPVLDVQLQSQDSPYAGEYDLVFDTMIVPISLAIEPSGAHRIIGLRLGTPFPHVRSWAEFDQRLALLPGWTSFQLLRLDDSKVLASYKPDDALGIGSAFKLYILASLLDQKTPWDRVVQVEDRLKSLGSGDMRTWPAGSPVTVSTLAIKMISQSDNTAADHALALAGRKNVEAMLSKLGMAKPSANIPFLSTRELFTLKSDPRLREQYLRSDESARRSILEKIDSGPLPDAYDDSTPVAIHTIQWFASSADLCRAMSWFDKRNDPTALAILAVNPGLPLSPGKFTFIGYKGGSESGVLCMAWLLRAADGHHYALAAIWNDPFKKVDSQKFIELMEAAAELIG